MNRIDTVGVSNVSPIEREATSSLVEAISERLEQMIIKGEIASGGKLNEYGLARQLQVSRSALREAARKLEKSGLVSIVPNRGVFVRQVSLEEALGLFDIRAGLARTAGRLVALRATEEQIAELTKLHNSMIQVLKERGFSDYYDLNLKFHSSLMAFSGNERLAMLYEMMSNELHLFRRRNLGNTAQLEDSVQEHGRILEGIIARDATRTGRAFERHILVGKQRMLDTLPTQLEG